METNWDLYKYFYFVCEFKNITRVAEYFCVTQPAITKKIKNLETELGRTLVISTNKGISITEDGEKIHKMLKPAFESFNSIESEFITDLKTSKPTIRIAVGYWSLKNVMIPSIAKFNRDYPDVDFYTITCSFEDSMRKLKSGEVDLVFFYGDKLKPGEDDSLTLKECYKIQDGFIVSKKIRHEYPEKISIYDINKYPLIIKDKSSQSRVLLERILQEKGIEVKPTYEASSYWALKSYIKANKGIGFYILDYLSEELEEGMYIEVPTIEQIPQRPMNCCYLRNSINKSILNKFISTVKDQWKIMKANKE